jgi:hypothetical protein
MRKWKLTIKRIHNRYVDWLQQRSACSRAARKRRTSIRWWVGCIAWRSSLYFMQAAVSRSWEFYCAAAAGGDCGLNKTSTCTRGEGRRGPRKTAAYRKHKTTSLCLQWYHLYCVHEDQVSVWHQCKWRRCNWISPREDDIMLQYEQPRSRGTFVGSEKPFRIAFYVYQGRASDEDKNGNAFLRFWNLGNWTNFLISSLGLHGWRTPVSRTMLKANDYRNITMRKKRLS